MTIKVRDLVAQCAKAAESSDPMAAVRAVVESLRGDIEAIERALEYQRVDLEVLTSGPRVRFGIDLVILVREIFQDRRFVSEERRLFRIVRYDNCCRVNLAL